MVPRQKHPVEDLTRSLLDESLVTATDCSEYGLSRKGWSWSNKAIYCLCASLFPLCFCVFIPLQFVYLDFWTRSLPGFVCFYSGLTLFFFSSRAFLFRSVPFFWISHRASSLSRRLRLRFSRIVKKKKSQRNDASVTGGGGTSLWLSILSASTFGWQSFSTHKCDLGCMTTWNRVLHFHSVALVLHPSPPSGRFFKTSLSCE